MKKNIFAMLLAVMMAFTPVSSLCAEEVILEEETGANQEIEAQSEGTDSRENTLIPEDGVQVLLEPSEDHPEGFNDNEDVQEGESILPGYTDSMASSIDSSLILSVEEVEDELGEGEDYTEETETILLDESIHGGDASDASISRLRAGIQPYNGSYGAQLDTCAQYIYNAFRKAYVEERSCGEVKIELQDAAMSFTVYPTDENGKTNWNLKTNTEYQEQVLPTLGATLSSAFCAFIYDYPEVFWLEGDESVALSLSYYRIAGAATGTAKVTAVTFKPKERYAGASAEIAEFDRAVASIAQKLYQGGNATRHKQILAIHDYICNQVEYGENDYCRSAAGVLLPKSGAVVCEGYAKAFKVLCDYFGIETVLIPGGALMSNGTREGHMWNAVKMEDGNWYLLDATWNDQKTYISRKYFLVGTSAVGFITSTTIAEERSVIYNNFSTNTSATKFGMPGITATSYIHNHAVVETSRTEATCTEDGRRYYGCSGCMETKEEVITKLGHSFTNYVSNQDATVLADGTKTAVCDHTGCGAKDTMGDAGSRLTSHTWMESSRTEATCTRDGIIYYECSGCTETKVETIIKLGHSFTNYVSNQDATVFADGTKTAVCDRAGCNETSTITDSGSRLKSVIKLNVTSLVIKKGQSTSALKVTGLAKGDSIASWKSSKTAIVTVNSKGVIKGKKAGTAYITVKLKSGPSRKVKVKVQNGTVKATKITNMPSKLTLKRGQSKTLSPTRLPLTCTQKLTWKSSNKKIATVNSKGKIVAKKAGTAKITVKCGSVSRTCKVTVKK